MFIFIILISEGAVYLMNILWIIGFEGLGNTDSFSTEDLEKRLGSSGVLSLPGQEKKQTSVFGFAKKTADDSASEEDPDEY